MTRWVIVAKSLYVGKNPSATQRQWALSKVHSEAKRVMAKFDIASGVERKLSVRFYQRVIRAHCAEISVWGYVAMYLPERR